MSNDKTDENEPIPEATPEQLESAAMAAVADGADGVGPVGLGVDGAAGAPAVSAALGVERWVTFAFLAAAGITFWFLKNLIVTVWDRFDEPQPVVATAVAGIVAVAAGVGLYRSPKSHDFATEVANEYGRVTWPTREEALNHTAVVLIVSLVATIILACFDYAWGALSDLLYQA